MARIIVVGGGVIGMSAAMLLARDGHEVTVLERDPAGAPGDVDDAWASWERRGVNQFRLLHWFHPRFRAIVEVELPEVAAEMSAAGALRISLLDLSPPSARGPRRDGDERFDALTARRPVAEAAIARAAEATPGLDVRRGVAVAGLLVGTPAQPGVPHVVGVRTGDGEELRADLVVDAGGRRSPLPMWLDAIGARPVVEEHEDSGFLYYGRHFRSGDGSYPEVKGDLLTSSGSVSVLTLPADNGTWGVGVITASGDRPLRALKDVDRWVATVSAMPSVAHWIDAEPLDDGVVVMAGIEDRHRSFVVDGAPVATGVVAVGDAWACTNPSVGRGASIGLIHAVALRDAIRGVSLDEPAAFALAWHDATMATVEPWYRSTLAFDRHRLAEMHAAADGQPYTPDDPGWAITGALGFGATRDPDLLRAFRDIVSVLATPDEVLARDGIFEKVLEADAERKGATPPPALTRDQLLATVAG